MSQRSLCSNVHHLLRHSKNSSKSSFVPRPGPAKRSHSITASSIHSPFSSSSRAIVTECRTSSSTCSTRRSFASSSKTNGWAPARRLDRAHPEPKTSSQEVVDHLRKIFPPLDFPEDVALRIVTHASWKGGEEGHNARLAFIGRRVLECYLNLFLHSRTNSGLLTPHLFHRMDYEELASKILDTHVIGEYVGSAWNLERIMRWVPSHTNDPSRTLWSSGLYRVRGTTVEAVIGGVFHQFGGLVAHRLFHTRLLPHLSAASMLPISDSIREAVEDASKAYGGPEAPLTRTAEKELSRTLDLPISATDSLRMPLGEFAFTGAKKPFPPGPPRLPGPKKSIRPLPSVGKKSRRGVKRLGSRRTTR